MTAQNSNLSSFEWVQCLCQSTTKVIEKTHDCHITIINNTTCYHLSCYHYLVIIYLVIIYLATIYLPSPIQWPQSLLDIVDVPFYTTSGKDTNEAMMNHGFHSCLVKVKVDTPM